MEVAASEPIGVTVGGCEYLLAVDVFGYLFCLFCGFGSYDHFCPVGAGEEPVYVGCEDGGGVGAGPVDDLGSNGEACAALALEGVDCLALPPTECATVPPLKFGGDVWAGSLAAESVWERGF